MIYHVQNFGAKADGVTNDAPAIQAAIDTCSAEGGGRVVLESGKTYYASSIVLKTGVDLHLERGSLLPTRVSRMTVSSTSVRRSHSNRPTPLSTPRTQTISRFPARAPSTATLMPLSSASAPITSLVIFIPVRLWFMSSTATTFPSPMWSCRTRPSGPCTRRAATTC